MQLISHVIIIYKIFIDIRENSDSLKFDIRPKKISLIDLFLHFIEWYCWRNKMLMEYLQGIDELPSQVTSLLKMAVDVPPIARAALSGALGAIGIIVLIIALMCLARAAKRQEKLHLSSPLPSNATSNKQGNLNPAFQGSTK